MKQSLKLIVLAVVILGAYMWGMYGGFTMAERLIDQRINSIVHFKCGERIPI